MKIDSSTINLESQHSSSRQVTLATSMRASIENTAASNDVTLATISAAGLQAALAPASTQAGTADATPPVDPKIQLLISLIESMTGRKVKLFNPNELKHGAAAQPRTAPRAQPPAKSSGTAPAQVPEIEYASHMKVSESEQTAFTAEGVVKTSDGKEIQLQLSMEMQRTFIQQSNVSASAEEPVKQDPLVVNFASAAAQLTDRKYSFDLNSDGKTEQMSFVAPGSGFLALDKNNNGVIDNGSELFGTKSGNGFADLSSYDSDKNGWIDENDAVYTKLKILSKNAQGLDTLSTLAEHKIGALYLGNVATPFELKNSTNTLQGQVQSSGIYLHEDGSVGTLQQVDLVV
jgi:hypothetical protein